jgi:glyoxylase-like metal-dependent hydrolase (beta-lactamase superfamily II)
MKIKVFNVNNFFIKNQCYLIYKKGIGILVDPAWDYNLINNFLIQNKITVKAVLLTHSHTDHTNLAEVFSKNKNIPVFMSGEEIDHYKFNIPKLNRVFHLENIIIYHFNITPIITPGHTLGSTCYLINNNLFSGDTVFIEGVGICNRTGAHKLYDSVQFLKEYLQKDTFFWPGHSFGEEPGKDLNYLLKHNIYFQIENRKHFIDFRTRKNGPFFTFN